MSDALPYWASKVTISEDVVYVGPPIDPILEQLHTDFCKMYVKLLKELYGKNLNK